MSDQALDLRRSLRIVRRYKIIVGVLAVLGLLGGGAYALRTPPPTTSTALVLLPTSVHDVQTQVVIAGSDPVLTIALRKVKPPVSLQALRSRVHVEKLTANVVSIGAEAKTAAEAEGTANAVADSYIAYLSANNNATGKVQAKLLSPAVNATGTSPRIHILITAGLGALAGILVAFIGVLAIGRRDRRLRQRDEIADAIGVPILASIPVHHPSDAAQWTRLLENYEPSAADAWRLRNALHHLGLGDMTSARAARGGGYSLSVLSLSSDRRALALGPQLAAFAASQGIPTALVLGPQQDANATATLRAACAAAAASRRSNGLWVAVADHDNPGRLPDAALTIAIAVVNGRNPRVADTMRTRATVLGVTAASATGEDLARVAASAASDGRQIEGILVADPDPDDHTNGRLPQVGRPAQQRMPTRMTGIVR